MPKHDYNAMAMRCHELAQLVFNPKLTIVFHQPLGRPHAASAAASE
jgi:hypothetical protein